MVKRSSQEKVTPGEEQEITKCNIEKIKESEETNEVIKEKVKLQKENEIKDEENQQQKKVIEMLMERLLQPKDLNNEIHQQSQDKEKQQKENEPEFFKAFRQTIVTMLQEIKEDVGRSMEKIEKIKDEEENNQIKLRTQEKEKIYAEVITSLKGKIKVSFVLLSISHESLF